MYYSKPVNCIFQSRFAHAALFCKKLQRLRYFRWRRWSW